MANKDAIRKLKGHTKQFEAAHFSPVLTYSLCLRIVQMPRCRDLVILVMMTNIQRTADGP